MRDLQAIVLTNENTEEFRRNQTRQLLWNDVRNAASDYRRAINNDMGNVVVEAYQGILNARLKLYSAAGYDDGSELLKNILN